jgi:2-polyprenyl-3-methyl-5-hydroxy-6-metoxy-1,4-benzoquinol methylase
MDRAASNSKGSRRVLVALASYGTSNDKYLARLIEEYRSMSFQVDIVVLSNIPKQLGPGIQVLVGLPDRNPWSLPFPHKEVFAERIEMYDIFVYSEDDMLITEHHLHAFLEVSAVLREDEIPGFIRIEKGPDGDLNYPDFHAHFHWDAASVRSRGAYTVAHFTNEHSACYVLTRDQLKQAIQSGGFLVGPHEWKYDLLCSAATDPYTQCGFKKLIPISHLDDFSIHHMSNKYIGRMGIGRTEMHSQVQAALRLVEGQISKPLLETETKLWRAMYSKDYYEPFSEEVASLVPRTARKVLSIGSGAGAIECSLADRGLRVVAVPLDPIICRSSAYKGVEIVLGDFRTARDKLETGEFDVLLLSNVLHLVDDPVEVLCLFRETLSVDPTIIITSPNMRCASFYWSKLRSGNRIDHLGSYDLTGVRLSSSASVRRWCENAGLKVQKTVALGSYRVERIRRLIPTFARNFVPNFIQRFLASDLIVMATKHL